MTGDSGGILGATERNLASEIRKAPRDAKSPALNSGGLLYRNSRYLPKSQTLQELVEKRISRQRIVGTSKSARVAIRTVKLNSSLLCPFQRQRLVVAVA